MSLSKTISALGLCAGAGLMAQEVPVPPPDLTQMKLAAEAKQLPVGAKFLSAEFGVPAKVVKGVPYQATATTESTQTLADGNRIVHKNTSLLARDSEGRTRREQKIDTVGQWSTGEQPAPLVFINDPVAQVNYVLEPNSKIARKALSGPRTEADVKKKAAMEAKQKAEGLAMVIADGGSGEGNFTVRTFHSGEPHFEPDGGEIVKESLGSKTIEGTVAEGTRFTRTVAAGKMGNDRPLTFVNETWYSSELGMIVMSRHSDPQMGETVYTLTNIQRSEPDPALFTVPADYTIKEGPGQVTVMFDKREN